MKDKLQLVLKLSGSYFRPGKKLFISLQVGQNFPSIRFPSSVGWFPYVFLYFFPLQITKFSGKEFPVLPVFPGLVDVLTFYSILPANMNLHCLSKVFGLEVTVTIASFNFEAQSRELEYHKIFIESWKLWTLEVGLGTQIYKGDPRNCAIFLVGMTSQ